MWVFVINAADLVSVVREVDLVEYLDGLVLDGLHLHLVRGILPLPRPRQAALLEKIGPTIFWKH
jgi:hypothetical protein